MELILISNDPNKASIAARSGVDRIMVDLELAGKHERQGHLDTVISHHSIEDIVPVRAAIPDLTLMVRCDPWPEAAQHVGPALAAGADILMLPMFKHEDDVHQFVEAIAGRARVSLLLETSEAVGCLDRVLAVPGIDEIHVGLNDLHLALGCRFMFELVANGTVEALGAQIRMAGLPFGFGGVARMGSGPLRPELILAEHVRLGSTRVILSRDFQNAFRAADPEAQLRRDVEAMRTELEALRRLPTAALQRRHADFVQLVEEIATTR